MKIDGREIHKNITSETILEAVQRSQTSLDNPGFCIGCGAEADSCEPDARKLECEACGAHLVYGAEELLLAIS